MLFAVCLSLIPLAADPGVDLVGLDGTLYDQVLDWLFYLGLQPARFKVSTDVEALLNLLLLESV